MSYATANRPPRHNDDDDQLDSEEEEEERLLSAEHGEASEDGPSRRKRTVNSTGFSEADAAAAKEFEEKVRAKKPRPALTPADLKGPKGLVVVRRSFPRQCKFRDPPSSKRAIGTGVKSSKFAQKMNQEAQITAAANYARSLMSSYRSFARSLFPSLAPDDVLLKIEDMGSKKEIKDYLQIMRNEMRREYLEGIYGEEKTERLLHELECGVSRPVETMVDDDYVPVNRMMGHAVLNHGEVGADVVVNEEERGSLVAFANHSRKEKDDIEDSVPNDVATDVSDGVDEQEELELVHQNEPLQENEDEVMGGNPCYFENEKPSGSEEIITEDDAAESAPTTQCSETCLETQETSFCPPTEDNEICVDGMNDTEQAANDVAALDGSMSKTDPGEDKFLQSEELAHSSATQETLTLVESQFDDEDQPSETENKTLRENVEAENRTTEEVPENKQSIEAQFNNSEDERFSQSNISIESTFEVKEGSQDKNAMVRNNEGDYQDNYMHPGQMPTEPSQLSMEY
ncbi:hypothetical protein HJC23_002402 [Cyclotella cryptica]|uniref:Chromosome segregation in meiosis protein 3 domain-containing protein n=1 Tax=Cyclotella cryptica TaxID=29204 RepID=A0ABD3QLN9_9STRA|eukprot:CCRYP_004506-RA/>CCRYP_004506-RA protein AED:0.42 eAED:0.42 QI:0/-1/0/1/-1/1/1/0/514